MPVTKNHSKDNLSKIDLLSKAKQNSSTVNVSRCRSTPIYTKDDSVAVDVEICECPPVPLRKEENVLLRSMVANRGMIHVSIKVLYCFS